MIDNSSQSINDRKPTKSMEEALKKKKKTTTLRIVEPMRTRSKRNNNNNNKKNRSNFSRASRDSFVWKKKGKNKKKKIGGSLIPFRSVTKLATALLAVVSYRDGFTRLVSSVGLALKSGIEAAACQSVIFYCTWIGSSGYDIVNHRE